MLFRIYGVDIQLINTVNSDFPARCQFHLKMESFLLDGNDLAGLDDTSAGFILYPDLTIA